MRVDGEELDLWVSGRDEPIRSKPQTWEVRAEFADAAGELLGTLHGTLAWQVSGKVPAAWRTTHIELLLAGETYALSARYKGSAHRPFAGFTATGQLVFDENRPPRDFQFSKDSREWVWLNRTRPFKVLPIP